MSDIGTLNEKPLHAALKKWAAKDGAQFEVKIDGYFIDVVQGELLIEIQTGNFASIKSKLTKLTEARRVRLVYPIAAEKWLMKLPKNENDKIIRRKSPKRGRVEDLFWQMVSFPTLLDNPNFSLQIVLTQEEEIRRFDPSLNWRRHNWGIAERRLIEVIDTVIFEAPADWLGMLPEKLKDFTTKDLAKELGIPLKLAQKMAYCLRETNVIEVIGKQGRANLYRVRGTSD